jgi:hypothetical protein
MFLIIHSIGRHNFSPPIANGGDLLFLHRRRRALKSTDGDFQSDRLTAATYGGNSGL